MAIVCGVDCATLRHPNWIAWLEDGQFVLDSYLPSVDQPLPALKFKPGEVRCYALDAPQSLPLRGDTARACDRLANTPTRRLPADRAELEQWRAYRGLIEVGVSIFWWVHDQQLASIAGTADAVAPLACETYPRYIIKRMWPALTIPSKKNQPMDYIDAIYSEIQKLGYVCRSVVRPSVDQLDAMLCAIAANTLVETGGLPAGSVGDAPLVDRDARVLRGGFIVAP